MIETGLLERLMILGFDKPDYSGSSTGAFLAYVNPAEITLSYELEYDSQQGAGTTNSRMEFKRVKPGDLTLNLFLDGTGADGREPQDVRAMVELFRAVTGYNGNIHRTSYLIVMWGTLEVRRCVLKSASIVYKLFQPNGVPLRATISATFSDPSDDRTRVALAQDRSAALDHFRLVREGDTLPLLCQQIYADPRRYLFVAASNGLDNFRALVPGTRLHFPPLPT